MREIEKLLIELIKIPSPNPPGYTNEIANHIASELEKTKIKVEVKGRVKRKMNVIARIEGEMEGKIIFNSHIDTVPIGNIKNWTVNPYGGEIRNNKIYGRGSSDCKAGVAAMMTAAKEIAESKPKHTIELHLVCDEETGGRNGTLHLAEMGYAEKAIAAISGEPCYNEKDNIRINVTAKGLIWMEVKIYGKAAHASTPNLGINAIERAAKIIEKLKAMPLPNITHKHVGPPTLTINMIKGGVKVNVIPDTCKIKLDRRITPQEDPKEAAKQIINEIESLKDIYSNLKYDYKVIKVWPPSETSEQEPIVQYTKTIMEQIIGKPPTISGIWGGTDMWIYRRRGIPTIHVGPGTSGNSHINDEYTETTPLHTAKKLYTTIMTKY